MGAGGIRREKEAQKEIVQGKMTGIGEHLEGCVGT